MGGTARGNVAGLERLKLCFISLLMYIFGSTQSVLQATEICPGILEADMLIANCKDSLYPVFLVAAYTRTSQICLASGQKSRCKPSVQQQLNNFKRSGPQAMANMGELALLRTSSFRFSCSFVARAANCCNSTGVGGVVMSRKYWKAWLMVQGGTRFSLVQLLITPEEKVAHHIPEFMSAYKLMRLSFYSIHFSGCTFIPCNVCPFASGVTHPGQCSSPPRTPFSQSDWQAEHPPVYLWEPTPDPRGCQGRCPDGLQACISGCLGYLCPTVPVWWNDCRNKKTLWRIYAI